MTIGIATSGPMAGLAAFRALAAVEAVGRGAIGGFVSFAAITASGEMMRAETQRGGTRTLFTAGESTGVDPPAAIAEAPVAALMSSGPDRPSPLSQFTPGAAEVGLVTGHRLPNLPGVDGRPIGEAVLAAMAAGKQPQDAVSLVMSENPEADAGVIAVARDGRIALADSLSVKKRDDIGSMLLENAATGGRVGVLHNAIFPAAALASLAASVALDLSAPADAWDFTVELTEGMRLEPGSENALYLTSDGSALRIVVAGAAWVSSSWEGAVLMRGAPVRRGDKDVGHVTAEPYCVAEGGRIVSLSGRSRIDLPIRASQERGDG